MKRHKPTGHWRDCIVFSRVCFRIMFRSHWSSVNITISHEVCRDRRTHLDGQGRKRTQAVLKSVSTSTAESQTQNLAFRYAFDVFKEPELDLGAFRCDRFVVKLSPFYCPQFYAQGRYFKTVFDV